MGTPKLISGLSMELAHTVSGMATDTLNTKNEYIRKLLTTLEAHQSVENNINSNESLSQAGKLQALAKLGSETTAPALKWLRPEIAKLQEKTQRYESQFYQVDSGLNDASERLPIYTYLWTRFDVLEQGGRIKQFLQASEHDQVVVMAAMLEHPLGVMIDESTKTAALIERARRLTPNDVTNYEQTQILLDFLTMARDWLGRWLALEVGVAIAVLRTNLGDEVAEALK